MSRWLKNSGRLPNKNQIMFLKLRRSTQKDYFPPLFGEGFFSSMKRKSFLFSLKTLRRVFFFSWMQWMNGDEENMENIFSLCRKREFLKNDLTQVFSSWQRGFFRQKQCPQCYQMLKKNWYQNKHKELILYFVLCKISTQSNKKEPRKKKDKKIQKLFFFSH